MIHDFILYGTVVTIVASLGLFIKSYFYIKSSSNKDVEAFYEIEKSIEANFSDVLQRIGKIECAQMKLNCTLVTDIEFLKKQINTSKDLAKEAIKSKEETRKDFSDTYADIRQQSIKLENMRDCVKLLMLTHKQNEAKEEAEASDDESN